jgi:uncharacterized protein (TIGR00159 family)
MALLPLFKIAFLSIRIIDLVDILLVGFLIFQLWRLIRGSLAYSIFIGLLIIYLISLLTRALDMRLTAQIFGQFIGVGVLALLIVFQPEVRRFLLYIGRGSELGRSSFWRRLNLKRLEDAFTGDALPDLVPSLHALARKRYGALIVFAQTSRLQLVAATGVPLDAAVSGRLLESIFFKNGPLHDGAVIVADRRIIAAQCILPVSENPNIPVRLGTRHRAAIGITEHSDATVIVVSEETGRISFVREGRIEEDIDDARLRTVLEWSLKGRLRSANSNTETETAPAS